MADDTRQSVVIVRLPLISTIFIDRVVLEELVSGSGFLLIGLFLTGISAFCRLVLFFEMLKRVVVGIELHRERVFRSDFLIDKNIQVEDDPLKMDYQELGRSTDPRQL